ncbi:hypothetical protein ASG72_04175 [Bosea sp. Leaf344]|nr:hypothetical protein ASG72_04175 [Bosea sp. Leaf344]
MGVKTFSPELPVERLDEGIVRWLARAGEVEGDAALIGPQVEVATDELGTLVDPDTGRETMGCADLLQHLDDVGAAEVEANVQPRREPAEGVDDGQNPQLAASGELSLGVEFSLKVGAENSLAGVLA